MKTITIAGGGVCGLSLGISLRRAGVPVILHEAGSYPRHKVCGEFLAGCRPPLLEQLGIAELFADARQNRRCTWYHRNHRILRKALPGMIPSLSRHALDSNLAEKFASLGGTLHTHAKLPTEDPPTGTVLTTGRVPDARSPWLGVKIHLLDFPLHDDLEMHLGKDAYFGLCQVEHNRVNLCGIVAKSRLPARTSHKQDFLPNLLRNCGLTDLVDRITTATPDIESQRTVAGLYYDRRPPDPGIVRLGDAHTPIPPFTGNGMTMALQSASLATPHLAAWARDNSREWKSCREAILRAQVRQFHGRLQRARFLQNWLLSPWRQRVLVGCGKLHLMPFSLLYRLLH